LRGRAYPGVFLPCVHRACQLALAALLLCCAGQLQAEDEQPEEDVSTLEKELVRVQPPRRQARSQNYVLPAVVLLVAGVFASRKLGSRIAAIKAQLAPTVHVPEAAADILEEDQSFSEFALLFGRAGCCFGRPRIGL